MKLYGWLGLLLLVVSEYCLLHKIEPFATWFYCFAWWSYILLADSVLLKIRGRSLLYSRRREFWTMLPISIFVWLIFEAFNFRIQNWSYSVVAMEAWQRWIGYLVSYATVLPGIFITADLVELLWKPSSGPAASEHAFLYSPETPRHSPLWIAFGLCMTVAPLVWPRYFFPAVWVGPIFLLNPLLGHLGIRALSFDLRSGDRRRIWCLMLAGLICGVLWEFWNYWAGSKWIYSVPFFGEWKVFEMPALGFLGFLPFALECWIIYHLFVAVLRRLHSRIAQAMLWLGTAAISVLIMMGIDAFTVINAG
jgi:hypothetical protein